MTKVRRSDHLEKLVVVGHGLARRGYRDWSLGLGQRLACGGGREGLKARIMKRRRRREPTFSRGRPDYPYMEEEGEDWNTPPWGHPQLRESSETTKPLLICKLLKSLIIRQIGNNLNTKYIVSYIPYTMFYSGPVIGLHFSTNLI